MEVLMTSGTSYGWACTTASVRLTRADFAPWLPPEREAQYDVFLSYRQSSDATLALKIYNKANCYGKVIACFVEQQQYDKILAYAQVIALALL